MSTTIVLITIAALAVAQAQEAGKTALTVARTQESEGSRATEQARSEGSRPTETPRSEGSRPASEGSRPTETPRSEGSRPAETPRSEGSRPAGSEGSRPTETPRSEGSRPAESPRSEGSRPAETGHSEGSRPSEGTRGSSPTRGTSGERSEGTRGSSPTRGTSGEHPEKENDDDDRIAAKLKSFDGRRDGGSATSSDTTKANDDKDETHSSGTAASRASIAHSENAERSEARGIKAKCSGDGAKRDDVITEVKSRLEAKGIKAKVTADPTDPLAINIETDDEALVSSAASVVAELSAVDSLEPYSVPVGQAASASALSVGVAALLSALAASF